MKNITPPVRPYVSGCPSRKRHPAVKQWQSRVGRGSNEDSSRRSDVTARRKRPETPEFLAQRGVPPLSTLERNTVSSLCRPAVAVMQAAQIRLGHDPSRSSSPNRATWTVLSGAETGGYVKFGQSSVGRKKPASASRQHPSFLPVFFLQKSFT